MVVPQLSEPGLAETTYLHPHRCCPSGPHHLESVKSAHALPASDRCACISHVLAHCLACFARSHSLHPFATATSQHRSDRLRALCPARALRHLFHFLFFDCLGTAYLGYVPRVLIFCCFWYVSFHHLLAPCRVAPLIYISYFCDTYNCIGTLSPRLRSSVPFCVIFVLLSFVRVGIVPFLFVYNSVPVRLFFFTFLSTLIMHAYLRITISTVLYALAMLYFVFIFEPVILCNRASNSVTCS